MKTLIEFVKLLFDHSENVARWLYTFTALGCLIGWGVYLMEKIPAMLEEPSAVDVFMALGIGATTTLLTVIVLLTVQYHFRKKPYQGPPAPPQQ